MYEGRTAVRSAGPPLPDRIMKKIFPVLFALLLLLPACKTGQHTITEYVYVEKVDTVQMMKLRVDSVVVRDSVVTLIKGDTVITDRWHTLYKEKVRVDTVSTVKYLTQYQTRTETVIKEVNVLRWWQKLLMWIGALSLISGIAVGMWKLKK